MMSRPGKGRFACFTKNKIYISLWTGLETRAAIKSINILPGEKGKNRSMKILFFFFSFFMRSPLLDRRQILVEYYGLINFCLESAHQ